MSRWEPIKLRNALTESWNDGHSIDHIMHEHGLDERTVVDYLDCARQGYHTRRSLNEFMDDKATESESHSKPSNKSSKVIPHSPPQSPLGAVSEAVAGMCVVCGHPILKTGRRGRPRTIHEECK